MGQKDESVHETTEEAHASTEEGHTGLDSGFGVGRGTRVSGSQTSGGMAERQAMAEVLGQGSDRNQNRDRGIGQCTELHHQRNRQLKPRDTAAPKIKKAEPFQIERIWNRADCMGTRRPPVAAPGTTVPTGTDTTGITITTSTAASQGPTTITPSALSSATIPTDWSIPRFPPSAATDGFPQRFPGEPAASLPQHPPTLEYDFPLRWKE